MIAAIDTSLAGTEDWSQNLFKRVVRGLRSQAEDWFDSCRRLSDWEDQHLADHPESAPARLRHAAILNDLEMLGQWLLWPMKDPHWPDANLRQLLESHLQTIKDRRAMWHGSMTEPKREQLLKEVFGES